MGVICNRLVWVRGMAHEAGTRFAVVDAPAADKEIDGFTAERWRQEGWLKPDTRKATADAASEGA